jgi:hypothetical protein
VSAIPTRKVLLKTSAKNKSYKYVKTRYPVGWLKIEIFLTMPCLEAPVSFVCGILFQQNFFVGVADILTIQCVEGKFQKQFCWLVTIEVPHAVFTFLCLGLWFASRTKPTNVFLKFLSSKIQNPSMCRSICFFVEETRSAMKSYSSLKIHSFQKNSKQGV